MSATAESDIGSALHAHLAGMAGVWPVAWPNTAFAPPSDGKYVRASFQPNEVQTRFSDPGAYRFIGIYQATVVSPLGEGEFVAMEQASLIARRFEHLTEIACDAGTIQIYERPSVRPGFVTQISHEMPVTIRYQITSD